MNFQISVLLRGYRSRVFKTSSMHRRNLLSDVQSRLRFKSALPSSKPMVCPSFMLSGDVDKRLQKLKKKWSERMNINQRSLAIYLNMRLSSSLSQVMKPTSPMKNQFSLYSITANKWGQSNWTWQNLLGTHMLLSLAKIYQRCLSLWNKKELYASFLKILTIVTMEVLKWSLK